MLFHRWAIVGVTTQLVLGQVQPQRYQRELESLQLHIGRLCPSIIDNDDNSSHHSASTIHHGYVGPVLKITSEKEYPFNNIITYYMNST